MRTQFNFDDWIFPLVEGRLRTLTEFGEDLERWADDDAARFRKSIDESAKDIVDDSERSNFYEWHIDTLNQYEEQYPQLGRELVLVKANFLLEAELKALAGWVERKRSIPGLSVFKHGKPSNSEIGFAVDYLEHNGVAVARGDAWTDIEAIRIMRNAIVHSDCSMSEEKFHAVRASRLHDLVDLKYGRLRLHRPLHNQVVRPVLEFFESAERAIYGAEV